MALIAIVFEVVTALGIVGSVSRAAISKVHLTKHVGASMCMVLALSNLAHLLFIRTSTPITLNICPHILFSSSLRPPKLHYILHICHFYNYWWIFTQKSAIRSEMPQLFILTLLIMTQQLYDHIRAVYLDPVSLLSTSIACNSRLAVPKHLNFNLPVFSLCTIYNLSWK